MIPETLQSRVSARVLKDTAFRQELLSNPRAVLAEQYHVQLPEGISVRVLEEAPNTMTIVLPMMEEAVMELTDADLQTASGAGASTLGGYPHTWSGRCRPLN